MKKSIMTTVAYPAPPPPPPPPSKGSRKTLAAIIVIIAIVIVIVGVYLATRSGGGGSSPSATPTPTPSATVTPTPTSTATATPTPSGGGANVAGASSLQYTVSVTNSSGASLGKYTYYAKNAGTPNMMIRIEFTDPSGESFVYIVNGALQKAWVQSGGEWTDLSSMYASQWSSWNSAFTGYKNSLTGWSGVGDWTYTDPNGDTVRIYDISVNPSLTDSLFQHS